MRAPLALACSIALAAGVALACFHAAQEGEDEGSGRKALGRTGPVPLPPIEGWTLEGEKVSLSALLGRRLVLVLFEPGAEESRVAARAVAPLLADRSRHNFEVVGIAVGADADAVRAYVVAEKLGFPILVDAERRVAEALSMEGAAVVLATDTAGFVVYAVRQFPGSGATAATRLATRLREQLRIPSPAAPLGDELLQRPPAPDLLAERLEGGPALQLGSLRGAPALLIFFLQDCPHCQAALRTLKQQLAELPEAKRPALLGVEISGRPKQIQPSLEAEGLDFFPVLLDEDWALRNAFGVFGEVPVTFLIDAEGGIAFRSKPGWDPERDPGILGRHLARLVGLPVALPDASSGYSGNELCGACHALEYATWQLTSHASAFDTLVTHGAERDAECVSCHVVGFGETGGYSLGYGRGHPPADLEDVGCEACHGRGGPHVSPDFASGGNYEPICLSCHDEKHSIFDHASFLPRISHAALASLSGEEREALLARAVQPGRLSGSAAFVGSDACAACHQTEYRTWQISRHAASLGSLFERGQSRNPECLRCHSTGLGRQGGLPVDEAPTAHPDLARVGCESCHGPGADHVAAGASRRGTILALTDKCDSCVILQICGTCHDDANDPGFRFEVERKIELQRHGNLKRAGSP